MLALHIILGMEKMDVRTCRDNFLNRELKRYNERETRRNALQLEIVPKIQRILKEYPSVTNAYLFGSILRKGGFGKNSDVDIAVEGVSPQHYFELWRKLEEELKITVDLRPVTERLAKTLMLTGENICQPPHA